MRTLRLHVPVVGTLILASVAASAFLDPRAAGVRDMRGACASSDKAYLRTTLYFGTSNSGGGVTEFEWQQFLRDEVTPVFPKGLTYWTASGQWRRADGRITQEQAKVLLLVHPEKTDVRAAIRRVVERYKATFRQDSVLSETAAVCAEF